MREKYDFSGWATKNDIRCADGRTIRDGAFKANDGQTVPLVYQHQHNDPSNVIGHALLEYRPGEGMYAYASCNQTPNGQLVKEAVAHRDLTAFSIYANQLEQNGGDVVHGRIREVSVVMAGANDGAVIEHPVLAHSGDLVEDEAIIYDNVVGLELYHADEKKEEKPVADENKVADNGEETVADVFDTLNEKQKKVVYFMIAQALENQSGEAEHSDYDEEENTLVHNVFDQDKQAQGSYLTHADMENILSEAKRCGSLREAIANNLEDGVLIHSIDTTGMETAVGSQTYGFNDPDMLFPDYKSLNTPPDWIKRRTEWVASVMGGVHHTPFSRIKSMYADITEDAARAKGYIKGNQKKTEVFTTLKRTTDPQTVYKFQKMDRDDILDITDFDVVAWIRAEMRMMLDEEIARAILIGDGREADDEAKISEEHVRPIASDVGLFNVKVLVNTEHGATAAEKAKAAIDAVIRSRKEYKGSGNPSFYTTEDFVSECLLLEDGIGHKLYKSVADLATTLRVKNIVTVEPMENHEVTYKIGTTSYTKPLIGVIVNLADYNVGADKGGQVTNFDDFDIEYNKYRYLIETRFSGALVKPFSALTILDNEAAS